MPKKPIVTLDFPQIYQGYARSITTAERLFEAGMALLNSHGDIALGPFELGQEEVGRTFLLLAAFGYGQDQNRRAGFWKDWRDHKKKVARSFFYEWLSPWRITVLDSKGVPLGGRSHEGFLGIPKEKEAAFYVNYDNSTGKFKGPEDAIELIDVFNRASSFLSHYTTASLTRKALDDGDREWNYKAFSEIPIRIMSVFTRQEEMPAVLNEFRSRSTKHKHLLETLSEHYSAGAVFMKSIKVDVVSQGS